MSPMYHIHMWCVMCLLWRYASVFLLVGFKMGWGDSSGIEGPPVVLQPWQCPGKPVGSAYWPQPSRGHHFPQWTSTANWAQRSFRYLLLSLLTHSFCTPVYIIEDMLLWSFWSFFFFLGRVISVEEGLTELLNIPNSARVVNLKFPRPGTWKLKVLQL